MFEIMKFEKTKAKFAAIGPMNKTEMICKFCLPGSSLH